MKKLIIISFMFLTYISFSQEIDYNKKHNLLWDIGVNHTSNFKPEYQTPYNVNFFPIPETKYPGYYLLPTFNYQSNFIYRFYFYKGFNINAKINVSYLKRVITRSVDSVHKYYVYPDSMIEELPFEFREIPLYSKSNRLEFTFNFSIGYRYKRLYSSFGIQIPLYRLSYSYVELKNNINNRYKYKRGFNELNYNGINVNFDARLEFLVLKKNPKLSVYIEASDLIFFGVLLNTSSLKLKK